MKRDLVFCVFKYFPFGGMQRNLLRIAQQCLELGFHVRVYTLDWEGTHPPGLEVVVVPIRGIANHRRYARFATWVGTEVAARPAACVVGFNKMPGLDVYYAADPCFVDKPTGVMNRLGARHRYFAGAERAVFGRGNGARILLIAANQQRAFEQHYRTEPERFRLLPPGITRDRMAPNDAAAVRRSLRDEFQIGEDQLLLLTIGSGFITKGLDRSLHALANLPPDLCRRTRLIAIGQDSSRRFRKLAARLGVADRFKVLRGRDDVPRFLQGADLLLHPAYAETAGNVLLEAIVAGLPSIVTDVCGNAPFVERACAGSVMRGPFLQDDFDARVAAMLNDVEQRALCRRSGIEFGKRSDLYSLPEHAARLIAEVAETNDRRVVSA